MHNWQLQDAKARFSELVKTRDKSTNRDIDL